jgi:hypothetical protein
MYALMQSFKRLVTNVDIIMIMKLCKKKNYEKLKCLLNDVIFYLVLSRWNIAAGLVALNHFVAHIYCSFVVLTSLQF